MVCHELLAAAAFLSGGISIAIRSALAPCLNALLPGGNITTFEPL